MNIEQELMNPNNWKMTRKKSYVIHVSKPRPGTGVKNHLEGSTYTTDQDKQFVLRGTANEQWVIDIGKLCKTYTDAQGRPITEDLLRSKMNQDGTIDWFPITPIIAGAPRNWAFHLPLSVKNFPVQTSWGDTLYANRPGVSHGRGDFLVCADAGGQPNLQDVWVVNGAIFPDT